MNYKETLFFIGKCLTINHENHNYIIVEESLKTNKIDWDSVVKVSTSHYVFPALYCNLKKAEFLHYLPNDLVAYMKHITDLNRERNQQIIEQAKEINDLLLANNITPIFLKGTGNLLEGLYDDIAERMVGDIDLLVKRTDLKKTKNLLLSKNYKSFPASLDDHRHLPRLVNKNKIGAVEIHDEMIKKKFSYLLNYKIISPQIMIKNNISFLSYNIQIEYTVLAFQINDYGYFFKKPSLKHSYDIFLMTTIYSYNMEINDHIFKYLNPYFALSSILLNSKLIKYKNTKNTIKYTRKSFLGLGKSNKLLHFQKSINRRLEIIFKSVTNKSYRNHIKNKIFNINWLKSKLGFKPNV